MASLKAAGKKGFVAYIGAGDPNLEATEKLAVALDRAGVDILELGVPFSDPLADGIVNQLAAQRGLESGTTPAKLFKSIASIRKDSEIPVVLYVYFNLIHRIGIAEFISQAAECGVDGLLVLDLPPEEADTYESVMKEKGLCPIYLIAPTTPEERIREIAPRASGFIYYISREGVTGMQSTVSSSIESRTALIHKYSSLPVAVGFGISNPDQAREVAASAEAIVVGSAIVNQICEHGKSPELVEKVSEYVAGLVQAIK